MAVQGIGAPFGIGLVASIGYFAKVRNQVIRAGENGEQGSAQAPSLHDET